MALLKRKQTPSFRKNIQHYKSYLRLDFEHRCAYCKNREAVEGGSKNFEIDHYKPKKKFPKLAYEYPNLFYSCRECNRTKSDYYHNIIEFIKGKYILNPCDHDFEKHYDMKRPEWKGETPVAFWNIEKLRLNSPQRVQIREDEELASEMISELKSTEEELKNLLSNKHLPESSKLSAKKELEIIQKNISYYKRKSFDPID